MCALAIAKISGQPNPDALLGPVVIYVIAAVELLAGLGLLLGAIISGSVVGLAIGLGGSLIAAFSTADDPCGCFGGMIEYTRHRHLAISLGMVSLFALLLYLREVERESLQPGPAHCG